MNEHMFVANGTKISECEHVKNIQSKLHSFVAVLSETKEKLINNNGVKTNFNVNQERKESLQLNTISCVQRTPVKKLPKICCPWPTSFKLCESLPWRGLLSTTDAASSQYFFLMTLCLPALPYCNIKETIQNPKDEKS